MILKNFITHRSNPEVVACPFGDPQKPMRAAMESVLTYTAHGLLHIVGMYPSRPLAT